MVRIELLKFIKKVDPTKSNVTMGGYSVESVLRWLFVANLLIPMLFCFFLPGLPAEGDALDYRIPLIQWFFRHGKYPNFSWTYVDDYPALGEMLMAVLSWISPRLMRLVALAGYVSFSFAVLALAKKFFSKTWAYLAVVLTMVTSLITLQDNLLMVDLLASSFLMWACVFFIQYLDGVKTRILWCGLFSGLALATRYTQIPAVFVLILFVLLAVYQKRDWVRLVPFALALILAPLPWLVRNFVVTGNPLYPLLFTIFGGTGLDSQRAFEITNIVSNYGFGVSLPNFILLPFLFAFFPAAFDYSAGPYFLAFLPWVAMNFFLLKDAYLCEKKFLLTKEIFIFLGLLLFTLAWFCSSQQTRFWLHVQPLVVCCAFIGMRAWFSEDRTGKGGTFYSALFIFFIALAFVGTFKHLKKHREEVFSKTGLVYQPDVVDWLNKKTPGNTTVLYLERTGNVGHIQRDFLFVYPHPYATRQFDSRLSISMPKYIESLKAQGVAYIYVVDLNQLSQEFRASLQLLYQGKQGGFVYAFK